MSSQMRDDWKGRSFQIGDAVTNRGGYAWTVTRLADADGWYEVTTPIGWTDKARAEDLVLVHPSHTRTDITLPF